MKNGCHSRDIQENVVYRQRAAEGLHPLIPGERRSLWLRQHAGRAGPAKFGMQTGASAERDPVLLAHGLDPRQRFHPDAHAADQISAGLKRLFHADARPNQGGARIPDQIDESLQRRAVGQEIVNEQDPIGGKQKLLGHNDIIHLAVGKGLHLRGIDIPRDILCLIFLAKITGQ